MNKIPKNNKIKEIKAIFTEIHPELRMPANVGTKKFGEINVLKEDDETRKAKISEAHKEAKKYADMLSDVRGREVSYMLSVGGGILAYIA